MISTSVLIHCKPNYLNEIKELGLNWSYSNRFGKDEIDVIVDDVAYEIVDGTYQDPDIELCDFYAIDYNKVNCIELA